MFPEDIDDLWHLNDSLKIQDAAALIAGYEPILIEWSYQEAKYFRSYSGPGEDSGINRVNIAMKALMTAVETDALPATFNTYSDGLYEEPSIDWSSGVIQVKDIKSWLSSKGVRKGFFFPDSSETPDYMNPDHPNYSPTLAAGVKVWEAMQDKELWEGKPVKAAMEEWLTMNYKQLGLTHMGTMSKTAVEEVAKMANWRKGGGATSTPIREDKSDPEA